MPYCCTCIPWTLLDWYQQTGRVHLFALWNHYVVWLCLIGSWVPSQIKQHAIVWHSPLIFFLWKGRIIATENQLSEELLPGLRVCLITCCADGQWCWFVRQQEALKMRTEHWNWCCHCNLESWSAASVVLNWCQSGITAWQNCVWTKSKQRNCWHQRTILWTVSGRACRCCSLARFVLFTTILYFLCSLWYEMLSSAKIHHKDDVKNIK